MSYNNKAYVRIQAVRRAPLCLSVLLSHLKLHLFLFVHQIYVSKLYCIGYNIDIKQKDSTLVLKNYMGASFIIRRSYGICGKNAFYLPASLATLSDLYHDPPGSHDPLVERPRSRSIHLSLGILY